MKNRPFFSIVTVIYNRSSELEDLILSLQKQTFRNFEHIIVDGGSNDGTVDIIKKYENNISKWISEPDKGIYDAMNKAIQMVSGEYVFFLNSDDRFYNSNVLEEVHLHILKDYSYDFYYGGVVIKYLDGRGEFLKKTILNTNNLKNGTMPSHQSMFFKKDLFNQFEKFNLSYRSSADFEYICRIVNKIKYRNIPVIISYFKSGGLSSNKKISYSETFKIITKYFGKLNGGIFFIRKILIEQNLKNIFRRLHLLALFYRYFA